MSKNEILEKIKKVKMRPKSYFILRTIIFILGLVFAFLFTIFLASFIVFALRASGVWYFSAFGFRGLRLFFASFPWVLLIFAILLIVLLEVFARKFSLVYRKPLLYSILGIIMIVILIGFAVGHTSMHFQLFRRAQEGRLPIMGHMYKSDFVELPHNVCIGNVLNIVNEGFQVETQNGEILAVIVSSETCLSAEENIKKDDLLIIMGERKDSTIEAMGIRKIGKGSAAYIYRRGNIRPPVRMK